MVRASVLIPTHDHATTLPLTVESVLRQSVAELEVLVIGDGVTQECRSAVEDLVAAEPRVRFLDFPKGPHHGESYRHEAVLAARSDAIFYLCDDDLVLPQHVADLLDLLAHADLVQSRNGYVRPSGEFGVYPTDLADRGCIDWHLREPRRNRTSITGTAHSRSFYLALGEPWETTPAGEWPDHFQWKKFFRHPEFRGATSHRMTALQFPTSLDGRESWTPAERREELARWAELVRRPDAQDRVDALVDRATQQGLAYAARDLDLTRERLAAAEARLGDLEGRLGVQRHRRRRLRRRLERSRRRQAEAQAELAAVRASTSWRLTAPLRALGGRIRGRRPPQ